MVWHDYVKIFSGRICRVNLCIRLYIYVSTKETLYISTIIFNETHVLNLQSTYKMSTTVMMSDAVTNRFLEFICALQFCSQNQTN